MHMCAHLQHPAASSVHWVQYETHPATSGVRNFHLVSDNPLTSLHKKVFMCLLAISLMYFLIELVSQLLFFQSPHYFTPLQVLIMWFSLYGRSQYDSLLYQNQHDRRAREREYASKIEVPIFYYLILNVTHHHFCCQKQTT